MALRTGFTTGAYAAATTLAAWRCLHSKRNGKRISLLFPDGKTRKINIDGWEKTANGARAWAKKDAGDDVDITNGAIVRAHVMSINGNQTVQEDYKIECGKGTLYLRAGKGVGISTREGLEIPVGKWAITPTPQAMISNNLKHAGMNLKKETWLTEISIDNGELLAKKTLNPMLGVEGGLSILGTSGIVVPCSNAAYIKTIEILLKGAYRVGCKTAVFVTGGRSHKAASELYSSLQEVSFIRIGDFIKEACDCAKAVGFNNVIVCCMPGKLAKYALGHEYTHAHHVALSMDNLSILLETSGLTPVNASYCSEAKSVREFLTRMTKNNRSKALKIMQYHAKEVLKSWIPDIEITVRVLAFDGKEWLI